MDNFNTGLMPRHSGLQSSITGVIVLCFLALNTAPAAAAIRAKIEQPTPAQALAPRQDQTTLLLEQLQVELAELQVQVKPSRDLIVKRTRKDEKTGKTITDISIIGTPAAPKVQALQERIAKIAAGLRQEDEATLVQFEVDRKHIVDHKLPAVILERHAEVVKLFKAKSVEVQDRLDKLGKAGTVMALHDQSQRLSTLFKLWEPKKAPSFDPKNLPFRTADPKVRKPMTSPVELRKLLAGTLLAQPLLDVAERREDVSASTIAAIEKAVEEGERYIIPADPMQVASAGSLAGLMGSVPMPGPEYLAPTEDVQITPEVQAKALELHNNPVEIYNWVRNNIDYIPSYGSIQGSQLTLDKKAGNAFDTSSLLVALLRAAGVPARYVYGTVDVPAEQLMNWIGGFTNPDAAQNLLGQGGIPNVALTQGGVTKAIRIEHVWVEAFVDYFPSRGAKNREPDAWVPMDASFKQYLYADGMNFDREVPIDSETFLHAVQEGSVVNESEGWIKNLNQANLQIQIDQYQQRLRGYIEQQRQSETINDILGHKEILPKKLSILAAGAPVKIVRVGGRFLQVPDELQHKFRYSIYLDEQQRQLDSPMLSYEIETVKLAGKKVALAFVPASEADRQAVNSYLPMPHEDGSPIEAKDFPRALPGYAIQVTPELRLDGLAVASAGSYTLGTSLTGEGGFTQMDLQGWDLTPDILVAGQIGALGISLQGIAGRQLDSLQARLQDTKQKLLSQNFVDISGEQLSGDLLAAVVWSYLASIESFGYLAQKKTEMVDVPGLSYGFFYAMAIPIRGYGGIVRSLTFPGVLLDAGHIRRTAYSKHNNQSDWIKYNRLKGQHSSAMEHAILEQAFDDPNDDFYPSGISASKALAIAGAEGQKIYTLTAANQGQLMSVQQSPAFMEEARNAFAAGKEIAVHERPINYAGFSGAGYEIIDPQTGAGAYLIQGGARGGQMGTAEGQLLAIVVGLAIFGGLAFGVSALLAGAAGILVLIPLLVTTIALAYIEGADPLNAATFRAIVAILVGAFVAPAIAEQLIISALIAYIFTLLLTVIRS
ncbi:transglutaminase domain-containing protein [Solimonas sp. K1W22B-7]|uniref:transglutaminase domain-containing protein n=1 Tax=Solimonas sp. K1W22B-7 TaxID=2303331 RepID=UPI000E334D33|nr:transglutaminase domain-containing protein [Solimonas sp. K1W22B-7]AXQ29710.1 transglutaminase domain-containing protein [Solimonas sp. K1W22B-7]